LCAGAQSAAAIFIPIMKRVQITLTDQETRILTNAAQKFGYSLHRMVQLAVCREVVRHLQHKEKEEYIEYFQGEDSHRRHLQIMKQFHKEDGDLYE